MTPALLLAAEPRGAHWRLGRLPPDGGEMVLLGWSGFSSVDAGVPTEVVDLLSVAFAEGARVTFPVSSPPLPAQAAWSEADGDQVRKVADSLLGGARAALAGRPAALTLLCARTPEHVRLMFEDPFYAFDAQATAAVLSPPRAPPPDLSASVWRTLVSPDWTRADLRGTGVAAAARPGVDGDLLGLWSLDAPFARALREALRGQAQRRGFDWIETDEATFAARLG